MLRRLTHLKRSSTSSLSFLSLQLASISSSPYRTHSRWRWRSSSTALRNIPPSTKQISSTTSSDKSTIYALSTAPGKAAIAIIRCSGPTCLDIYRVLCPKTSLPKPRYATLRTLYAPTNHKFGNSVLDSGALILYFPAPKTVTGEDVLELHIHGGPAVVRAVLAGISQAGSHDSSNGTNVRYAEPGEFTRRAFYNNRLDLTQVEALGDTLSAETEQQRQLAVRNTSNTLFERYENWRFLLLQARGELEALIDFSEDQHFDDSPAEFTASVSTQVVDLKSRIRASIDNAAKGELLRSGISIALLGAPNVGKSSLLNRIVGREAAIVSDEAGTTRDIVDVNVDIGGFFCKFGDLAGLRAAAVSSLPASAIGAVEKEGMRRAKARALSSDVVVVVLALPVNEEAGVKQPPATHNPLVEVDPEVWETLMQLDLNRQRVLFVVNKMDLFPSLNLDALEFTKDLLPENFRDAPIVSISCVEDGASSRGIQLLLTKLTDCFASLTTASEVGESSNVQSWDESLGASERQRLLLVQAESHLDDFLGCVGTAGAATTEENMEVDIVVAAESLRTAAQALSKITGKGEAGDVEEVLGVVFEKFCVGK